MIIDFDTNPFFILSRPADERRALFDSLVQQDAVDKLVKWFAQRNRTLTQEEAWRLLAKAIGMAQCIHLLPSPPSA